jgi:hypothetical protein
MPAKIRLIDGREVTVTVSGKRVVETIDQAAQGASNFTPFKTVAGARVWVNPAHVVAIEDQADPDARA